MEINAQKKQIIASCTANNWSEMKLKAEKIEKDNGPVQSCGRSIGAKIYAIFFKPSKK